MVDVEAAFRTAFAAAVAGIVGEHVYADVVPQGVPRPYFAFSRIGGEVGQMQTGPDGLELTNFQLEAFADDRATRHAMMSAADGALNGFGPATSAGIWVQSIRKETMPIYRVQPAPEGSEDHVYTASTDYGVWHEET